MNWANLPFLTGTYRILDLWKGLDVGKTDVRYTAQIASHDVVLLRLSPVAVK